MAPGPVHQQQQQQQQGTLTTPSPSTITTTGTTTNTTSLEQGHPPLPTQEEAQVCTLVMSTLLECRLQEALAAESGSIPPCKIYYKETDKDSEFVTCHDRDRMVRWLCILAHDFHYCLEVFFRAASILDTFLSTMKVRPKFLLCVSATCFFIASKLEEKPENVDSVLAAVVTNYNCEFSVRDIHRMELIIIQKLDFKLNNYTPYDFLKIFHVVGISNGSLSLPVGLSPEQHLCHTALCMEEIVSNHSFMKFRPSLLALAVLGCDLKLLGCDWLTAVVTLQNLACMMLRGGELSVCYEAVAPFYNMIAVQHPIYISSSPQDSEDGGKGDGARPVALAGASRVAEGSFEVSVPVGRGGNETTCKKTSSGGIRGSVNGVGVTEEVCANGEAASGPVKVVKVVT